LPLAILSTESDQIENVIVHGILSLDNRQEEE